MEGVTTVGTLTFTTLTGWSRDKDCPKDYKRHVFYSTCRSLFSHLSVKQMQAIQPTTVEGYESFAKKKGFDLELVELDDGASGCCMGPKTAKKTLLWFHGGGYTFPASDQHWVMLWDLVELAKKNGEELRVMVLEYELTPYGHYPLQLKQAAAAVKYLLHSGLQPSQILFGGDSAGGNLAAALISHLSHPHPSVSPISLSSNLGGALLISPWASFTQKRESWKKNFKRDALVPATVRVWSDNFMAQSPQDNWNHPAEAPAEWWKDIKVDNVAIVGGQNEILMDDIREVAEKIKVHNPTVDFLEAPGEAHDAIILDRTFGMKDELASEQFIDKWILARLK
ncbi:uncharacterized protein Z519_11152 [Cladophialophora bantiana CBS 173.52]|uniref:Alpha/beta hydrolase fold-3 domain-containing protein n=1 Tax=Cladophialophora bantiana (strain ATCC 10958 / CBS 173.52 / CDC B-1940 / NIH 8579) TaxID=1442370 RepID=A0A0D2FMX9_CLAB1|nr:uncharacterized protein Z519_11152 [Cladophialophora bantiana CBS 173.52]KIW88042.1 hypothetical protein Z519_11152 [Cladophialophora bantiana CBS 173.52]